MSFPKKQVKFTEAKGHNISQIYSSGLQYALASDEFEQACEFVYCKDFFQDAYQAHFVNRSGSIYGFSYTPGKNASVSIRSLNLLVINSFDNSFLSKVDAALDFLVQIEQEMKIHVKTTIFEVENPPEWAVKKKMPIFLFVANKRWYASPVMISLYTLLLRIAFLHSKGKNYKDTINALCRGDIQPYQVYDQGYMMSGAAGLAHILKKGDRKVFGRNAEANFKADIDINTMHNSMGIVGYSQEICRNLYPEWYDGFEKTSFGDGKNFSFKV